MNCFLIDFENVKSTGLKGIEHLIESDDVYIFYSEYANTITFDVHHKINKSHANLKFFKSGIVAKNALDFQLISYLGYLIAQKKSLWNRGRLPPSRSQGRPEWPCRRSLGRSRSRM